MKKTQFSSIKQAGTIFLAMFAMCFTVSKTHAQGTVGYVYTENGLQEVEINQSAVLVYFKTAEISVQQINGQFECLRTVGLNRVKADSLYAVEVAVGDDYGKEVTSLKERSDVWDVEPVLGDKNRYPVSNMFYVKLKQESDTGLLSNVASYFNASVDRKVPYCGLWYELSVSKNSYTDALGMSVEFGKTELFAAVDPGVIFEVQPYDVPCMTDSMYSSQWGLDAISACDAWQITTGDTSVHVAVIDQGVDLTHREFSNINVTASCDTYHGTNIYGSHGTLVGGIIFSGHNDYQIAGMAPDASLIKISDTIRGLFDDIIPRMATAFGFAVAHGADVISNSWGGFYPHDHWTFPRFFLDNAIENALVNGRNGKGCVVVFSSGNYASGETSSVRYPANSLDGILSVGSVDGNLQKSGFSCYGSELDIVAPGEQIYSSTLNNQYVSQNGTSFSAPYVSGVAALMLSANPNMTNRHVSRIIEGTAKKLTGYSSSYDGVHFSGGWNSQVGYGMLDAAAAVENALNLASKDLYIKDNPSDDGTEYNQNSTVANNSPDIKVYSMSTGIEVTDLNYGSMYQIKVTLRNDRNNSVTISPSKLKVYWTVQTGNIQWRNTWDNASPSFCGLPVCGFVSPLSNIVVPANGQKTVSILFPAPVFSTNTCSLYPMPQSIALVAVVDDGNLIIGENDATMPIEMFVRANNNVAWHSYTMSENNDLPFDPDAQSCGLCSVSPNPTDGRAIVRVSTEITSEQLTIAVINSFGNIVHIENLNHGETSVDVNGLTAGNYTVYLLSSGAPVDVTTLIVK